MTCAREGDKGDIVLHAAAVPATGKRTRALQRHHVVGRSVTAKTGIQSDNRVLVQKPMFWGSLAHCSSLQGFWPVGGEAL